MPHVENDVPWEYEADHADDYGGADTFHHIVCGERHIAEVATEADARMIVAAVNAARVIPPAGSSAPSAETGLCDALVAEIAKHRPSGFVNSLEGWVECECGVRIPCQLDRDGNPLNWEAEHLARAEHLATAILLRSVWPRATHTFPLDGGNDA